MLRWHLFVCRRTRRPAGVDEIYDRAIVGPILGASRWLWRIVDVGMIDGFANALAAAAQTLADSWRRWATGNVQHYALTLLVGVVVVIVAVAVSAGG